MENADEHTDKDNDEGEHTCKDDAGDEHTDKLMLRIKTLTKVEKLAPLTKCAKISTLYMAHNSVKWDEQVFEQILRKNLVFCENITEWIGEGLKQFPTRSMDEFSHLAALPEVNPVPSFCFWKSRNNKRNPG